MKDALEILKEFKIVASKFTAKESKEEREYILKSFKNGDIEALVSMKVLDEGVDIPSAKYAFFLASSTNYREFVQRRGRVLRKDDSKDKAYIYDFIVIPPEKSDEPSDNIVKRELERVFDFIKSASNSFYAKSEIIDILIKYNLTEYLREDYEER
jgi:superfamily II DNA or RNA helicase